MRIISNFKDYYDFSGFAVHGGDYRDTVYLRKTALKVADAILQSDDCLKYYDGDRDKIISKWWQKNKKLFSLPDMPHSVRSGCLFVCGKAYPFLFLRDTAQIGMDGKNGQVRFSRYFNEAIKNSIVKKQEKPYWERDKKDEEEFNFFRTYYSADEFFEDVSIEKYMAYYSRWCRSDNLDRDIRRFFEFYEGKDFTALHLRLDSPLLLTLFECKEGNRGSLKTEYEFLLNPNLYELDFMRIVPGEIMLQEFELFLGNVLVKDIMPSSYQSDFDKLTAHGFDPKTSFRNIKNKR